MIEPTVEMSATQDETTKLLSGIWQDLLGIRPIGLNQNYFDLGGDSSLAVQLFAQIESVFNVKLPLATLFEAPTVAELAQILRRESSSSDWSSLVAIQPEGSRPPFFCIHGAGGNVLIYRDLSKHLGPDQPFYGLQSRGLDGSSTPLTRIEDMAALYLKEIRRVQQHGPYLLGGYCFGGTVAFEIARQLQAKGERITLLALFDTMNWAKVGHPSIWGKSYNAWQKLYFHSANFISLDFSGKKDFFLEKLKILWNRIPVWRGMLLGKLGENLSAEKSESRILGQIWQTNDRAAADYFPEPIAGVVTDFRPKKQYRMLNRPDLKWEKLAHGGQEVVVLPVYPAGMLVEPFVKHLAVALKSSIDKAILATEAKKF